ncbi:MAG TPA: transglycosylase SLT domain-containing protein [Dongiaceae bacterium]|jgi:soluble lytic murein transglycosylase-like protein|nr:transglycosylase SLT domain-containing protein [Dongiaceae bacterium]
MPDGPDWRWAKAQGVQESGLDPAICSGAGACGIMQIMPATWTEICRALGWRDVSRRSAPHSIFGGTYYQARMDRIWWRGRTIAERHALGLASYNAGPGSILAAQAACGGARLWPGIASCLAAVTGAANARQTTDYVRNIGRWRMAIKGCRWRGHRGGCAPGGWT